MHTTPSLLDVSQHRSIRMKYRTLCFLAIASFGFLSRCGAQPQKVNEQLTVGGRAPTSAVATFVSGPWSKRESRSACPILINYQHAKIAVYLRNTDDKIAMTLKAFDKLTGTEPALDWSFVFVTHENTPTPTDEEFESLLGATTQFAKKHQIANLSFGVMKQVKESGGRFKQKLGFVADDEVVVMLITPNANAPKVKWSHIRYARVLKSSQLDSASVVSMVNEIRAALVKYHQSQKTAG